MVRTIKKIIRISLILLVSLLTSPVYALSDGKNRIYIKGNVGIELKKPKSLLSEFEYFFSEDQGRYIIEITKSNLKKVSNFLVKNSVHFEEIGILKGKSMYFNEKTIVPIDELKTYNNNWLTNYMNK